LRQAFRNLQGELEERQRAEEILRQSEAHYRALVEGSLQGISIVKRDGTRVFANSALARMLGCEGPEELVGRSIWPYVAPHELSRFRAAFETHLRGEPAPAPYEYQVVKKDGTLIWVEHLVSLMMLNGEPVIELGPSLGLATGLSMLKRIRNIVRAQRSPWRGVAGDISAGPG
jgi:PAS domain S-box-containing protein